MQFDPRTVARDIPGIFDVVFPQLTPGVVAHFNREASYIEATPVDSALLHASTLQAAMLAELGFVMAERQLLGELRDWDLGLQTAVDRQKRHYDAVIPAALTLEDKAAALALAESLGEMIQAISDDIGCAPNLGPSVPGFEWIATGVGDFEVGSSLIEVKFGSRNFSSADYRQVVIYWLLGYLHSLEASSPVWKEFILLNPRLGRSVRVDFKPFVSFISAGRTTVEIAQVFAELIGTRSGKN